MTRTVTPEPIAEQDTSRVARPRISAERIEPYVLPTLFVAIFVTFALLPATSADFLTTANIRGVFANQAIIAITALAVLPTIVAGQYDLSVGAIVGASAMAVAGAGSAGWPTPLVLLAGPVVGLLLGAVNGILVSLLRINSLITTIGMTSVILGFAEWYSEGTSVLFTPPHVLTQTTFGEWLGLPKAVWWVIIIAAVVFVLLEFTVRGRHFHALGSSPGAARLVGLSTPWLTLGAFLCTGLIAGVAGVLDAAENGSISAQNGPGFTLLALAAVFLGSTAIQPGRFNVLGTIIAVYLVAIIVNGLTLAGAAAWVEPLFNGAALLAAVAVSVAFGKRAGRIDST